MRLSDERWTATAILVCLYAIFVVWFCGFPMAPIPLTEVDAEVSFGAPSRLAPAVISVASPASPHTRTCAPLPSRVAIATSHAPARM